MPTRAREQTWLGHNLMSLRQKTRMTQRRLAEKAGVSLGILQKLEQGWSENPRLNTLRQLAKALNVAIGRLVEDAGADTLMRPAGQ